jgi:hypothetical protein
MEMGAVPVGLEALAGLANMKDDSEAESAVEMLSLIISHEQTDLDTKQYAEPVLETLKGKLSESAFEGAVEKGKQGDLESVLGELIG